MTSTPADTAPDRERQWYIRRGEVVRGPFPKEKVSQYLLRGNIKKGDELSQDRQTWRLATECNELLQELMVNKDDDALVRQQMMAKKHWEAERDRLNEESRYQQTNQTIESQRRVTELLERDTETVSSEEKLSGPESKRPNRIVVGTIFFVLLSAIIALIFFKQPAVDEGEIDCNAVPAPRVNWSNCQMEAAQLSSADLSGAVMQNMNLMRANLRGSVLVTANLSYSNLSAAVLRGADFRAAKLVGANFKGADLRKVNFDGADLSYVDFHNAKIRGASFTNVKFDKAKWVDGRICAVGSVGRCL